MSLLACTHCYATMCSVFSLLCSQQFVMFIDFQYEVTIVIIIFPTLYIHICSERQLISLCAKPSNVSSRLWCGGKNVGCSSIKSLFPIGCRTDS